MQSSKVFGIELQLYIISTHKKRVFQQKILSNVIYLLAKVIYLDITTGR